MAFRVCRTWFAAMVIAWMVRSAPLAAQSPVGNAGPTTSQPAGKDTGTSGPLVQLNPGEVPKISFDSLEYTYPRVVTGKDVFHDFTFKNTGNGPLEILAVRPGCGCTTAGAFDRVVAPGGMGRIPLKMNTDKFSGFISKSTMVVTNCVQPDSAITLIMKGDVWEPVTFMPKTVGFGRVSLQDPKSLAATQTLTIINNSPKPASLSPPKSNNPGVKGEMKVVEPGKKWEVIVSLVPPLQGGVLGASLEFETGVAEMPRLEVPVSAYLAADIEIFPNRLQLPPNRANDLQRQFSIVNNSTTPIKIWEAKSSNTSLKTSIEETRPGFAFKLLLDVPKSYALRKGGDVISVRTDSATSPMLSIVISEAKMGGAMRGEAVNVGQPAVVDPANPTVPVKP
ncbi:MAG: DUF1573 domain-containing protein [Planctomycetota bacterium]